MPIVNIIKSIGIYALTLVLVNSYCIEGFIYVNE